jgi:hypothetical protein
VPDIGPVPLEELDRCKCPQKAKPKKRKPRTQCYRGTYVETARGTTKHKIELITCE